LIFCLVAAGATDARADSRHAAFVVDANTGRVLHAANADDRRFPASLTKMMTLYLVFEQIEAGRLDASTPIRISAQAAAVPPSKLDLDPGDTIPLGAAIRALVTKSANDVSVAIAEHISGSEAAFARAMTAKARQLGMRATVYRNAHGLPDPEQVTTARDILTLSLALYDHFPQHARVFATRQFNYAGAAYRNHNTMLGSFEGMEGIKTGYTRASGFNLSASVRRDGKHVVAVVMGGRTAAARNAEMRMLLNRSLARASTSKSRRPALIARAEPAAVPRPRPASRPARTAPQETAAAPQAAPRLVEPIRPATPPASAGNEPPIQMARVRTVPVVQSPGGGASIAATRPSLPRATTSPRIRLPMRRSLRRHRPTPLQPTTATMPSRSARLPRPWRPRRVCAKCARASAASSPRRPISRSPSRKAPARSIAPVLPASMPDLPPRHAPRFGASVLIVSSRACAETHGRNVYEYRRSITLCRSRRAPGADAAVAASQSRIGRADIGAGPHRRLAHGDVGLHG